MPRNPTRKELVALILWACIEVGGVIGAVLGAVTNNDHVVLFGFLVAIYAHLNRIEATP